jgi:hypothetical protein
VARYSLRSMAWGKGRVHRQVAKFAKQNQGI